MGAELFFTLILVLLNGFFVAAEFAIVKVRASQIDIKAAKGSKNAQIAKHIIEHLDSYLSASQLGITLASLALGWVGEDVFAQIMFSLFEKIGLSPANATVHAIAIAFAFASITILHIIIGEQAPKTFAIGKPFETTMLIAAPLRIFYVVFKPFIWFINTLSNFCLRLFGIKSLHDEDVHTEEELRMILTESEEGGAIKPSENELIQNVFDFDDRLVKQIMVDRTKITSINIAQTKDEIIEALIHEGYSRIPVYKDELDNVIGILHSKDILKVVFNEAANTIQDLIRPAYFVPESKKINELLRDFQQQHIQMAIVTNEFGGVSGIVTMEDIIEELVGEIQDEHDEEKPNVEKLSEDEFIINALASLSDINEFLPLALPEGAHYETISGFVNYTFGRIPAVNEKKTVAGYEFIIMKRKKQMVTSVKIKLLDKSNIESE
jgi:CBS domain containing-hemolysin-like protein